ncbi:Aste57867_7566 [Aphanomyces stellatus]|uniref:Aste57867_7566 protein n=1 Tax=Aphanomyces stellatus TaxID=120398 RepID=A0A485KIK0_9STRA|nr:hypothetical protein As57867_007540 [Aphanomyces stellatus]VFT84475.1 Aste57867_7566 [Aphanomyces stellatus]
MGSPHPLYEANETLQGRAVVVSLHSLVFVRGALFSIDPESGNVILFQCDDDTPTDKVRTQTVMAHAIASIEVDEEGMDIATLRRRLDQTGAGKANTLTPDTVQRFLHERCIDSRVDAATQNLIVFGGAATITPPYDEYSVCARNDLVLQRLATLLRQFE